MNYVHLPVHHTLPVSFSTLHIISGYPFLFSLLVHPATRYRFVYIATSAGSFYFSWFQVNHISAAMTYSPFDPVSFAGLWFASWAFWAFYVFSHLPAPFMKSSSTLFFQVTTSVSFGLYGSGIGIHAVTKTSYSV